MVLKPHLLRHAFATHAVQVEKIPIDIVGEWLKQKSLHVTDYYSQPTESMVAEAVDLYLARTAVSIDLGKAVQRTPQELQQLYEQARGKAGTLADVIGGQCVSSTHQLVMYYFQACSGTLTDLGLALLPIAILRKSNLPVRDKVTAGGIILLAVLYVG